MFSIPHQRQGLERLGRGARKDRPFDVAPAGEEMAAGVDHSGRAAVSALDCTAPGGLDHHRCDSAGFVRRIGANRRFAGGAVASVIHGPVIHRVTGPDNRTEKRIPRLGKLARPQYQ